MSNKQSSSIKIFLFLLIAAFSVTAVAQSEQTAVTNDSIYTSADVKPEFPGGLAKFYKYLTSNIVIRTRTEEQQKVFVQFVVERDGTLADLKVLRNPDKVIKQSLLDVFRKSPKWTPAVINGEYVRFGYTMPIIIPANSKPGSIQNERLRTTKPGPPDTPRY